MKLGKRVFKKYDIKKSKPKFSKGGWSGIVVFKDTITGDMSVGRTMSLTRYLGKMNFTTIKDGVYGKFAQMLSVDNLEVYYLEIDDFKQIRDVQNEVRKSITAKKKKDHPQQSLNFKLIPIKTVKLEDFAKKHNLQMTVREKSPNQLGRRWGKELRYYASFDNCDIKDGSFIVGSCGDGETPDKAIKNYADSISEKLLVVNALSKTLRVEIKVPRLII